MNEADWLKAKNPQAMLELVEPHLSPRQWSLLACMFVRRLSKLLGHERLTSALSWAERSATETDAAELTEHRAALPAAIAEATQRAQDEQRAIVLAADPDSDPAQFLHVEGRKTNPAAPLFQAAAERARRSVEAAGLAAAEAGSAVQLVLEGVAGVRELREVRAAVREATQLQALAGLHGSLALKLLGLGEESADRDTGRDVGKRYGSALTTVEREVEYAERREDTLGDQRARSLEKALGSYLLELCGNVCRPAAIDPAWLTADVLAIAQTADAERDFTALPILGDALLDAGCNSRPILRHCRGLKEHADEHVQHAPGCWVIDAILGRKAAFRERLPLGTAGPAPRKRTRRS